ncbi:MAG: hypothetical protein KGQ37_01175 [Hyphomicrobiales bacterium]|nr:hypothetical protein [Hyphomicrobiales bacterium]
MQLHLDQGYVPGGFARPAARHFRDVAPLMMPACMARFHGRRGASGRRYHFTRYECRDDIADFTNILILALDAQGRPCSLTHVGSEGSTSLILGCAVSQQEPACWDIRFLPPDRTEAEAVIRDLACRGEA